MWHRLGLCIAALWVSTLLFPPLAVARKPAPIRVLILSGKNNHDFKQTTPELVRLLQDSGRFSVDVTDNPAGCDAASLARYDVIVSNWTNWPDVNKREWGEVAEKALLGSVRGGKGFVVFHAASTAFQNWPEFQQIVGSTWDLGRTGHGRIHTFKVAIADKTHPITAGMGDFEIRDELWHRTRKQPNIHVLCTATSAKDTGGSGEVEVVAHCQQFGKGRCFNLVLGHDVEAMRSPGWQSLMLRGIEWAATGTVVDAAPAASQPTSVGIDPTTVDVDGELASAAKYTFGQSRAPLLRLEAAAQSAANRPAVRNQLVSKILPLLGANSAATTDGKKALCRIVGFIGSADEVPVLAAMLNDKEMSLAARSALQWIPGEAPLAALREALAESTGPMLAGLVNTLGERRDGASADAIARHLADPDPIVAGACADALGKITGPTATAALLGAQSTAPAQLKPLLCDALLKCAERLVADGKASEAASIYESLSAPDKPAYVRLAAFPRLIACKGAGADDLLLSALTGKDAILRSAAIWSIRAGEKGTGQDRAFGLLARALASCQEVEAKRALLVHLGGIPSTKAIRLAVSHLREPGLANVAAEAILRIAPGLHDADRDQVKAALQEILSASPSPQLRGRVMAAMLRLERPANLAVGAKASSPDGLDKDGASNGDQAAIDGKPRTYWDEVDNQKLYRLKITFKQPTEVSAINIMGYEHQNYAPKDFQILCDDKVVKTVEGAAYDNNEVVVVFPRTRCSTLELKITGYYGQSPAIRELEIYDAGSLDAGLEK